MAGSLNKVQLIGSLGRDPESRSFQNGGKVCELRIATSQSWKDRTTGEKKERTEWHTVKIFNEGTANFAERYLRKGSRVYVEGALETRKWQDQQGQDRYSVEVTVRPYAGEVIDLSPRQSGGGDSGSVNQARGGGGDGFGDQTRSYAAGSFGGDDLDDDVPFITADVRASLRAS